jgi:hypothetical protein
MDWTEAMRPTGDIDKIARMSAAALLAVWLIFYGAIYHAEYPRTAIELSGQPWWRALLVGGVLAAAWWCPRVGALAALTLILYLTDLRALTTL